MLDALSKMLSGLGSGSSGQIDKSQLPSGPQSVYNPEQARDEGFFSNLMSALEGKGNQLAIMADTAGQRLNPTASNVMGGLGTQFAKSDIASKQIAQDKAEYKNMLTQVLEDLQSGSDMNQVGMKRDPLTGELKIDTQTKIPRKIDETLPTKESSVPASSAASQQPQAQPGSMQSLYDKYGQ